MVDSTAQPAATSAWGSSAPSAFMGTPLFRGKGLMSGAAPATSAPAGFAAGAKGAPTSSAAAQGMAPGAQPVRRQIRRVHKHKAQAAAGAAPQPANVAPPPSSPQAAAQLPLRFKFVETTGHPGDMQAPGIPADWPSAGGAPQDATFAAAAEGLPQRFAGSVNLGPDKPHNPRKREGSTQAFAAPAGAPSDPLLLVACRWNVQVAAMLVTRAWTSHKHWA